MSIRSMLLAILFGGVLGCAVAYWGKPAHAAELHYQCADYAPYPHVVWRDCGPAVRVSDIGGYQSLTDHTPFKPDPSVTPNSSTPAASDHQPPRFLPAVVLYDKDDRFLVIEVGKVFAYSCKGALDDAQATIEKATAAGRRLVGLCVPVPTYNPADLVPAADPPKAQPDNAV